MELITKDTSEFKDGIYGIRWYKYISGCAEEYIDKVYGGANWFWLNPSENSTNLTGSLMTEYPFTTDEPKSLDTFPFSLEAPILATKEKEQFKAVCLKKTYPLINDPTYEVIEHWTSNIITFENTNEETSGGENITEVMHRDLALVFDDNSFGNYFIYDQNGELLDKLKEGSNKNRRMMLYYKGMAIDENNPLDVTKVVWHLPNKENSMIAYSVDQHKNQPAAKEFIYTILENLNPNASDNTVQCEVFVSGQLYLTLTETLRFGKQGSNGTTNTFLLEMMDGKNALPLTHYIKNSLITADNFANYELYTKSGGTYTLVTADAIFNASEQYYEKIENLRVQAILIKDTGKRVYFTKDEANKIEWTLLNNEHIIKQAWKTDDIHDIITLSLDSQEVPNDNYTILKASYQYQDTGPKLEAYLPIPIKNPICDKMVGATQVLYNHQGVPKYNNGAYIGTQVEWNGTKWVTTEYKNWDISQSNKNPNPMSLKQLKADEEGYGLVAPVLYSKGSKKDSNGNLLELQDEVCVYCKSGEKILWSQPILVMQSQYDFAMLNEWDGSLTINEKNGTILSTMLGAGRKNEQNQFSGVLIGAIDDGTQLKESENLLTGVYGLQNGIITYGLKEDGTAFFGAYANGRIEIDGNSGIIRSAGWINKNNSWKLKTSTDTEDEYATIPIKSTGSLFDLDDGMLVMQGPNSYFKFNADADNTLKLKLSGANIILNDKSNKGLSGYIDITAKGLTSEFRRTAVYAVTCASTEATKVLSLADFSKAAFNSSSAGDTSGTITNLTTDDILKEGVTIAVTFDKAEDVKSEDINITQSIDGKTEIVGKRTRRTGRALFIQIGSDSNSSRAIWLNKKATNSTPNIATTVTSLTVKDNKDLKDDPDSNPYGWGAGTTIYFTYKDGHWEVSDSGSYSKITQTADMIKTEVSNVAGTLGSSITQTASNIRMEVAKKANYNCECDTEDKTSTKVIKTELKDASGIKLTAIESGCIINIKFTYAETEGKNIKFKINNSNTMVYPVSGTSVTWKAGETIPFAYNGTAWVMTSLSNAYIEVKDNEIIERVEDTEDGINQLKINTTGITADSIGRTGTGFGWALNNNAFILRTLKSDGSQKAEVFKCDKDGVTITGNITANTLTLTSSSEAAITAVVDGKIAANAIEIKNSSGSTIFKASGNEVKMAGWEVHPTYIVKYGSNASWSSFDKTGSFLLMSAGTSPTMSFGGSGSKSNWRLAIGQYFGVDSEGNLYCSSGTFKGTLSGVSGTFSSLTANNQLIMNGKAIYFGANENTSCYIQRTSYGSYGNVLYIRADTELVLSGTTVCLGNGSRGDGVKIESNVPFNFHGFTVARTASPTGNYENDSYAYFLSGALVNKIGDLLTRVSALEK